MKNKIYNTIMGVIAAGVALGICFGIEFASNNILQNRERVKDNNNKIMVASVNDLESTNKKNNAVTTTPILIYSNDSSEEQERGEEEIVTSPIITTTTLLSSVTKEEINMVTDVDIEQSETIISNSEYSENALDNYESETMYNDYENDSYDYNDNYLYTDYSPNDLYVLGVIYWGGYRYTWYSELVLSGGGLDIWGRHVDNDGFVCDGDGYICVASGSLAKGTIVNTPFGRYGKVYDCGCDYDVIDCYVHW